MKRFYTLVSTEPSDGGVRILLDGKAVKCQSGAPLLCINQEIADCVMQEWAAQKDEILPDTMPFTQIENTRIDRVQQEREAMSKAVLKYLDTDLLCYVAGEPDALVTLQNEKWAPWCRWFEDYFDTSLQTTSGLSALKQNDKAHSAVQKYVESLSLAHFTILQLATSLCGSIILALAFTSNKASAEDLLSATYVEEDFKSALYNAEKYGEDPSLQKQKNAARIDLEAAHKYLSCL